MKLPNGWHWEEISQLADINSRSLPTNTQPDYRFRYIDLSCVRKGHIDWPKVDTVLSEAPSRAQRVIVKNDVLMALVRPNLQSFAVVNTAVRDIVVSTGFAVLSPKSRCDGSFLYQSLFGGKLTAQISRLTAGSSYPALSSSEVETLVVAVPANIPEQQKIADILGTWDEALEKLNALIAAKDRRKQALMQQLLTGKLRLRGFKNHAWNSVHMGDALERVFRPVEMAQNATLALVSIRRRLGGLFRRPDVLASEYKTQDLHAIKVGDFLISKRQVVHGAWAIVETEFDGTLVSKEYAILVNRAPDTLDIRFFAWLAQTPRLVRLARVASTGVHIEKLIFDPDVFLREKIRIPSEVKEQTAIAAILDTADAELRLLHQQRTALDHQKRGLMQQLLTGRIRVSP